MCFADAHARSGARSLLLCCDLGFVQVFTFCDTYVEQFAIGIFISIWEFHLYNMAVNQMGQQYTASGLAVFFQLCSFLGEDDGREVFLCDGSFYLMTGLARLLIVLFVLVSKRSR